MPMMMMMMMMMRMVMAMEAIVALWRRESKHK